MAEVYQFFSLKMHKIFGGLDYFSYLCTITIIIENIMYNTEEFIRRAKLVHGDRYRYTDVVYVNSITNVRIICPIHGVFWQRPSEHLRGKGCIKCGQALCGEKQRNKAKETFVSRCKKIHGDKYTYDKVDYVDSHTKIVVTCKEHGDFNTLPYRLLNGCGCPKCKSEKAHRLFSKGTSKFIEDAKRIHGDLYDYRSCDYYNNSTKVIIICREHGAFEIGAGEHLRGCGCPLCKESMGEKRIRLYLESHHIQFVRQYAIKYNDNKYKSDFFIPSQNLIIEYNGEQHYKPVGKFGGAKAFHKQQQRDKNLREYCKAFGIKLLEISYLQYPIIEQMLDVVFDV